VAGDNLQDLKAGYIVGATPWRQQVMLAVGSISCALVMAPTLNLLNEAYGIGVPTEAHPDPLLAPQATLMASVARGLFGGALPWGMVAIGAGIGIAIIIVDEILRRRGAKFRTPVLAVAVGIYLPLELMVPIFLGGLLNHLVTRKIGAGLSEEEAEKRNRTGMLFAAGLITGEALMGIFMAIPIVAAGEGDVLALPASWQIGGEWGGLLLLAGVAFWLYRVGLRGRQ
jgi:putative OPT family oligopeptide transporter